VCQLVSMGLRPARGSCSVGKATTERGKGEKLKAACKAAC
jgi:hypothetical protein